MRKLLLLSMLLPVTALAQHTYTLTEPAHPHSVEEGYLQMGGRSPQGGTISVNSDYIMMDGTPVIPVMGEFHYARYPESQWEEQLMKMKAGGVNIVATYVFWNLHEEHEGQWLWTGNRDLRRFVSLCQRHGLKVVVRIGPFCHGEVRNGGFPDWLFGKPLYVRCDDALYLSYVKKLYAQIARQLQGLYYQDGGPVIGCQIENEMQHSASTWAVKYVGEPADFTTAPEDAKTAKVEASAQDQKVEHAREGDQHMLTLLHLAQDAGIRTPLYTATGWGYGATLGRYGLPVGAGYPFAVWERQVPSTFCMFKDLKHQPDYPPARYDGNRFPALTAELGAGIQMGYTTRPLIDARSIEAFIVRTIGSGGNLIGYYMYQGGTTPRQASGDNFFNDGPTPKTSYDFQAPLGEYGLEHASYRPLRLLHLFLNDYGSQLAPMQTVLPADAASMTPTNRDDLRWAARMKDGRGFLFLVNAQDHDTLRHDMADLCLSLNLKQGPLRIPERGTITLKKDVSMILPFNMPMADATLCYATAQPLMTITDRGLKHYLFFAQPGMDVEYAFSGIKGKAVRRVSQPGTASTFVVTTASGQRFLVTTLTRQQALDATKVDGHLLITQATVAPDTASATLLSLGSNRFSYVLYPSAKGWKPQTVTVPEVQPQYSWKRVGSRRATVHFTDSIPAPQVQEYFLKVDYTGDVAFAFLGGGLVQDHLWHGRPWVIGLGRHRAALAKEDLSFYFRPLHQQASFLRDLPKALWPDFSHGPVLDLRDMRLIPEYRTVIKW